MRLDFLIEIERRDVKTVSLIVAECKQFACDEGLTQTIGYMQAAFNEAGDGLCMAFVAMCKIANF